MSARKLVGREQEVIELYTSGKTPKEIGECFGCSNVTVFNILKRFGIPTRGAAEAKLKYSCDWDFFQKIDTENKAYVLGMLYADGYVSISTRQVSLTLCDYDSVFDVRNAMKSNHSIYEGRNYYRNTTFQIKIFSEKMINDLIRLGCGERKSLILIFPTEQQVPSHLIHHFVRGYFDGDGCAFKRRAEKTSEKEYVNATMCGTEAFLKTLSELLPCKSDVRPRKIAKIHDLWITSHTETIKFRDWLYRDATIWMERKREILFSAKDLEIFSSPYFCPSCGGKSTNSKGVNTAGNQRINCKDCKRSFTLIENVVF